MRRHIGCRKGFRPVDSSRQTLRRLDVWTTMDMDATARHADPRARRRLIVGVVVGTAAAIAIAATVFAVTAGGGDEEQPQARAQQAGLAGATDGAQSPAGASPSVSASAPVKTAGD